MSAVQQAPMASRMQPRQVRTTNLDRQLCKIRFSPCGRFLAGGGFDATVRRWQVNDAALNPMPNLTGHHGWVQTLAFHPDRQRLITADSWGDVRIWPFADPNPSPLRVLAGAHDGWIRDLAVSNDGRLLATCGADRKVCVWSIDDGRKHHELTGHPDAVLAVAFHPDNRALVSGDLRGNVYQWDTTTGQKGRELDCRLMYTLNRLQDYGGVRRLVFDAQGRTLACAGGRAGTSGAVPTTLIFDWAAGRLQHTLTVGAANDGFVYDLAFHSADFVMGVASGTPGSGKFFFHRPGESAPFFLNTSMPNCHSLAVHPDGRRLLVCATNGGSNGNGRPLRNGEYIGNTSPLHLWELPASPQPGS